MSSQKGNPVRCRPQKFKNATTFKNNMFDKSEKTKMLNKKEIVSLCSRCKDIIKWKIKYKKYKPLTVPAKCIKCEQKTVKEAYHAVCKNCCEALGICAKCLEKQESKTREGYEGSDNGE